MKEVIKYKNISAGILIIGAVLAIIYGSLQPLTKSQSFIKGLQNFSQIKTFGDFTTQFDAIFNYPSPVGNEEIGRFLSDQITSIISQQNQPEDVSRALVSYMEPHMTQNDLQTFLTDAHFHLILWENFHKTEDYSAAEQAYLKALAIGPKLPPVLYGLASLYASGSDRVKFIQTAETILSYWPDDAQLKNLLLSMGSPTSTVPAAK